MWWFPISQTSAPLLPPLTQRGPSLVVASNDRIFKNDRANDDDSKNILSCIVMIKSNFSAMLQPLGSNGVRSSSRLLICQYFLHWCVPQEGRCQQIPSQRIPLAWTICSSGRWVCGIACKTKQGKGIAPNCSSCSAHTLDKQIQSGSKILVLEWRTR